MSLKPATYQDALEAARLRPSKPRTPMSRGKRGFTAPVACANGRHATSLAKPLLARTALNAKPRRRLQSKPSPELLAWGREVRKRDNYTCQWVNCEFCHNVPKGATMDPHHIAERSLRPDLRLILANGTVVCRRRHDFIHSEEGRDEAITRGFLSLRTRELAAKEGTLGIR